MTARRRRGFALATTFIVAFLVLLAGFTMAGLASFNYNLAKQNLLREEAFEAANAGLNSAIAQLIQDAAWGSSQPRNRTGDTLPFTSLPNSTDPVSFYVSFLQPPVALHPGYPTDLPYSVNNFSGAVSVNGPVDPVSGSPRQVPAGSALIFAEGVAGQGSLRQVRIVEALLQAPTYPYAISASNAVVTWASCSVSGWCVSKGSYYRRDAYRASKVDGLTSQDVGSILVAPPKGQSYTGGFCGGPGGQYGVYLGPGSIVTGAVTHAVGPGTQGRTNVVAVSPAPCVCCFPTHCGGTLCYQVVHRPPQAACVSTPDPCQGQVLPPFESVTAGSVNCYSCPHYYAFQGCGRGYCPGHRPYKFYTACRNGYSPGNPCCPCSHPVVRADTYVDACGGCVSLGRGLGYCDSRCHAACAHPIEFDCDYTLTVHGYLQLPGGVAGRHVCCHCLPYQRAQATLLILPVPLPTPGVVPTNTPDPHRSSSISFWPYVNNFEVASDAGLSVLATGNLQLLTRDLINPSGRCDDTEVWSWRGRFTMEGIITVAGNLDDAMGSLHVEGLLVADNPWDQTAAWGNILLRDGAWVSYSPTQARASWVGQTVVGASTKNGLQVVYWREARPGP